MERRIYDPRHEQPRQPIEIVSSPDNCDLTSPDVMAGHIVTSKVVAVVGIGFAPKKSK